MTIKSACRKASHGVKSFGKRHLKRRGTLKGRKKWVDDRPVREGVSNGIHGRARRLAERQQEASRRACRSDAKTQKGSGTFGDESSRCLHTRFCSFSPEIRHVRAGGSDYRLRSQRCGKRLLGCGSSTFPSVTDCAAKGDTLPRTAPCPKRLARGPPAIVIGKLMISVMIM